MFYKTTEYNNDVYDSINVLFPETTFKSQTLKRKRHYMYDDIFVADSTGSCHFENVVKIAIFPFQWIYNEMYVERLMIFRIFVIWSIPFRLDQFISILMRYMYIWLQSLSPYLPR